MVRMGTRSILTTAVLAWSEDARGQAPVPIAEAGVSDARGLSNTMNPAISLVGQVMGSGSSARQDPEGEQDGLGTGLSVPEVELALAGIVDPYFRADVFVAFEDLEGVAVEEAYVTTLALPVLTLRAGKFKAVFGKHNAWHSHLWPFVDGPLVHAALLGEEGLADPGVEAAVLFPTPWFLELTLEALDGSSEKLFASIEPFDLAYVAHLRSLWELGAASTFELGGSGALGQNFRGEATKVAGVDATFRWRPPSRAVYRSLQVQGEYLVARDRPDDPADMGGVVGLVRWQFARRWWAQARHDFLGLPRPSGTDPAQRTTGLVAFVPTEFSVLRLQYSFVQARQAPDFHEVALHLGFLIGSHPAHPY